MSQNTQEQHECHDCKMKFETAQQLNNHSKKFCIYGDYGTLDKLDQKASQPEQRFPQSTIKPSVQVKDPSNLRNYGSFTIDQIKSNMKSQDPDFKKLEDIVLRKREDELLMDVQQSRKDLEHDKIMMEMDEGAYQQLIQETELKAEKEFQARIEKDGIRKQLGEIDSWKMSVLDEQRKHELERLLAERESQRQKQSQLIEDIIRFMQGQRSFSNLLKLLNVSDIKPIKQAQYSEIKQKLVNLSLRRDQLENDRVRIQENLERLRLGDLQALRRGQSGASVRAAEQMLNESGMQRRQQYDEIGRMKDKITSDQNRIELLRKQQQQQQQQLQQQQYQQYNQKINTPNQGTRQQLQPPISSQGERADYGDRVIDDLKKLKLDYESAGGRDPQFLNNIQNLEKFYKGDKFQVTQGMQVNLTEQIPKSEQQVQFNQKSLKKVRGQKIDVSDPFDSFSRKKEFFLLNNVRGVDLTKEEQILVSLSMQEVDSLRAISRIPVGTELYRFKMEQFKELSTTRSEIEKVLQEQRLERIRRKFEQKRRDQDRVYDNTKWVDDNRRYIIEQRLRNDLQQTQPEIIENENREYDPSEGLVVHWDYILGLPRRTKLCQLVYAVYNNMKQEFAPKLQEPFDCEVESQTTNRVLFGESNQIYDIQQHQETLLIMEIQFPKSKRLEDNFGQTESFAWTQLDLFDQQRQLKRGKFKCPLYIGPTDPAITIEEIAKLEPIPNAFIYIRITYPNDEELGQMRSIYPEQTQQEYNIPQIHLRGLFDRNYEFATQKPVLIKQSEEQERQITPQSRPDSIQLPNLERGSYRGISICIDQVINHIAVNHMRVMAAILFKQELLMDDQGLPIAFNTTIHDPTSQFKSRANEGQMVPLVVANPEYDGISNKADGSTDIKFYEEYRIYFDMVNLAAKSRSPIYLGIQIVEKAGDANESKNNTFTNFSLIGWQFIEIVGARAQVNAGKQIAQLYYPPLKRPPIDPSTVQQIEEKVQLKIQDFIYTEDEMLEWRNQRF